MRDQNAIETMMTIVEEVLEDNEGEIGISDLSVVRDVLAWVLDPKVSDVRCVPNVLLRPVRRVG